MHRAVASFLSARDLSALSWTCANAYFAIDVQWSAELHARFPYKKFAPKEFARKWSHRCGARKFLLNIESRAGHAQTFFAMHSGRANCAIECEGGARILYVDAIDTIIRGDIIIDLHANAYIFDGFRAHPIARTTHNGTIDSMDLSKVFTIPREFPISYYNRWYDIGITIGFRIDPDVIYAMDQYDEDWCDIEYDNVIYKLSCDSVYDYWKYEKMIKHDAVFAIDTIISHGNEYILCSFDSP